MSLKSMSTYSKFSYHTCTKTFFVDSSKPLQGEEAYMKHTGHANDEGLALVEAEAGHEGAQAAVDVRQAALRLGDGQAAGGQRRAGHGRPHYAVQIHHIPVCTSPYLLSEVMMAMIGDDYGVQNRVIFAAQNG